MAEHQIVDKIFGNCFVFKANQLPTKADVLKHFLFLRRKNLNCDKFEHIEQTAQSIENIWRKTKIPVIKSKSIYNKLTRLNNGYTAVFKNSSKPNFNSIASEYLEKTENELFDIAICSCIEKCTCSYSFKVPIKDRPFLSDQRGQRNMFLDPNTIVNTPMSSNISSPKPKRNKKDNAQTTHVPVTERATKSKDVVTKNLRLTNTVREMQRNNISPQVGATLFNAALKDIKAGAKENAVDRNKLIREMQKFNSKAEEEHLFKIKETIANVKFFGLYFDGKKDRTNVLQIDTNGRKHQRQETEDHYTLVIQPGNHFYTHVTPSKSDAASIANCIWNKLRSDSIDFEKLMFAGSDGTVTNTGYLNGMY